MAGQGLGVALLRDRKGLGDAVLALGDRSAINALIATHGVVMDTKQRVLWVGESPHLLGRFVAFDLKILRFLPEGLVAGFLEQCVDHQAIGEQPRKAITVGRPR